MISTDVIPMMAIISDLFLLPTAFDVSSFPFYDHTYDYLGMKRRTYNSLDELVKENAAQVYAGIHYTYSKTAVEENCTEY
jgi:hypothetical protein